MRAFRSVNYLCVIAVFITIFPASLFSSASPAVSSSVQFAAVDRYNFAPQQYQQALSGTPSGPLFVNPDNPRYFTDGTLANGKYKSVFLTGSHTWCNFIDCDDTNTVSATFNYTAYLDFLQSKNHNFFRLWRAENARGGEAGDNFWFDPMPYQRSTTCCAFDGKNKFNLNQFNQAYFDRMRQRIIQAGNRGIYVSIMLFDGWSVESKQSGHQPWKGHPYKLSNNINNINGDVNNDGQGGETHTLASSQVTALQESYVAKVIETIHDLDNVLFEVSNESSGSSTAWQYEIINYIKTYEQSHGYKKHPVGMTWQYPNGSNTDLTNSPADWISLGTNGVDLNTYVPPVATGNKVIISDTDHLCGICGIRQWVWKSFTRGENPIFMDIYDNATSGRGAPFTNTNEVTIRNNLGYVHAYASRMELTAMTPTSDTSLCSTGYCLRKPTTNGAEYLVYRPATSGGITVNLSAVAPTKQLKVEWFNPNTGVTVSGGTVSGGGASLFTPPFSGDAVLYIYDASFVDVPLSHPYYYDIQTLFANGYTAGCSVTPLKFCPDVIMDRAQSAVFMLRGNFGSSYAPVTPTHFFEDNWANVLWAEGWAESMYLEGLTGGCSLSPLKFCPSDQLTNVQAAVFGVRLKHGISFVPPAPSGTVFADMTDVNFWGLSWAEQAYADGLIPSCGISGGKPLYCPTSLVSRGFGAYVIVRAKNLTMP